MIWEFLVAFGLLTGAGLFWWRKPTAAGSDTGAHPSPRIRVPMAGEKWDFRSLDPWETIHHSVVITETLEGWVRFQYFRESTGNFGDKRERLSEFLDSYTPPEYVAQKPPPDDLEQAEKEVEEFLHPSTDRKRA